MTAVVEDTTCTETTAEGLRCAKKVIPSLGIHAGGCWFTDARGKELFDRGHIDATRLLAGEPAEAHLPEECTPACPQWMEIR